LQFRGEKSQDKANGRIFQGCSGGLPVSRWFIIAGLVLVALGLILHYAPWLLNWFGRLPGDIRTEGEQTRVFIPNHLNDYCESCTDPGAEPVLALTGSLRPRE